MIGCSNVSALYQNIKKINRVILLCGLIPINSFSFATTTCPDLKINAICLGNAWQVSIIPGGEKWQLMNESVNGAPCNDTVHADEVFWNYAFSSERMGLVGCNYTLYNNKFNQIGHIQLKSNYYVRTGSHWERGSHPGNWSCHASQVGCLFS